MHFFLGALRANSEYASHVYLFVQYSFLEFCFNISTIQKISERLGIPINMYVAHGETSFYCESLNL